MLLFRKAVKKIFAPPKIDTPSVPVPTPVEDAKKAQAATDEANRKARAALAAQERGGRQSTLYGAMTAQADIESQKRRLGGV